MTKIINWGIIGCGDVTEKKSGPAFNKVDHSKLIAVMRRNLLKAKDYALRHHVPYYYNDAASLIASPEVDAIYIATPPSTHAYYAIQAMMAGKPVYVEKPMASSYKECQEMNRVSKETGVPLFVAYYRRTLPGFLKVKELIESDSIGKPLAVNIRLTRPANIDEQNKGWRVDRSIAGGGIFHDLASHQFDFLDFLFGPIVEAQGCSSNNNHWYEVEDTVSACYKFSNGLVGNGLWSFVAANEAKEDTMEIIGSNGVVKFSGFDHQAIELHTQGGVLEFPYLNPENIQYNLIKQVTESLLFGKDCVSTGLSAARTNKILEEITRNG
ncbi:Gfo/Idh/MocA family protein [Saccharicrinis fermentans]|uniref:Glucose-fructose oxidoreductase n=1 Tax=Saccharicrinis fermentans DSM 9555 = JCM 21142 TaxID=869213 RepID=W7Y9T5_9BACT|nr:Gfo/Idh/MocA family oxidoreductase [Saccharicrinis fermentans]GAF04278.1 glucose-fructose oxidoreductase precursor [Saccharicrinis fermentans DSM 9555 = JCM 21142]